MKMNDSADYVFLHGGAQGGWVWDKTIEAMRCQTNNSYGSALALDVPGCGTKRDRPTEDLKIADVANELVADIEAAGLKKVILVGHSQAGQVMPRMAAIRPALFERLVFVSCLAQLPGKDFHQMFGKGVHGENVDEIGWPADPETISVAERRKLSFCNDMEPEQIASLFAKLGQDAWPPQTFTETDWRYDHLSVIPSTYVVCLQDMAIPVPWQESFAKRFRVDNIVRIDAGHQAMMTRPHSLAEILRQKTRL